MTIKKIYTIRDIKADVCLDPFAFSHEAEALRQFYIMANDKQHQFHMFPTDFVLYELADIDLQSGDITPLYPPKPIASANDLKRRDDVNGIQTDLVERAEHSNEIWNRLKEEMNEETT